MLYGKQILLGAITLIATLGSRSMVHGQPQAAPLPAPSAASPAPQFRPLTEADAQADLAELKSAAAAVDQRFATAGDSLPDAVVGAPEDGVFDVNTLSPIRQHEDLKWCASHTRSVTFRMRLPLN